MGFFGLSIEVPGHPKQHVKATLPPSLYFPGEAEIRYYIKTTINRPGLLRENPRVFTNLNFVPIEPPRPTTDGEVYARRQHQFITDRYNPPQWERKNSGGLKGLFRKDSSTPETPTSPIPSPIIPSEPARFSIDARLPNPAILTCGEDLPLKVIVRQLSELNEPLYLQNLHIELIGYTKVRAEDAVRTETHSWVIISLSAMHRLIGTSSDVVDTETELSKDLWEGKPLPNTVAPSFVTCNIQRWYELVVSVGLSYGSDRKRVRSLLHKHLPMLRRSVTHISRINSSPSPSAQKSKSTLASARPTRFSNAWPPLRHSQAPLHVLHKLSLNNDLPVLLPPPRRRPLRLRKSPRPCMMRRRRAMKMLSRAIYRLLMGRDRIMRRRRRRRGRVRCLRRDRGNVWVDFVSVIISIRLCLFTLPLLRLASQLMPFDVFIKCRTF